MFFFTVSCFRIIRVVNKESWASGLAGGFEKWQLKCHEFLLLVVLSMFSSVMQRT